MSEIRSHYESNYELNLKSGSKYSKLFIDTGFVHLPKFFTHTTFQKLKVEILNLIEETNRKKIYIEESKSWRVMNTLGTKQLGKLSSSISELYHSNNLLSFLTGIADQEVKIVPDENEQYVLNCLLERGDFHGAHVDDYAFAFNIIVEQPPHDCGGDLYLEKDLKNEAQLIDVLKTVNFRDGDAYFLRTDRYVHGVSPLKKKSRRVLLNFAYRTKNNTVIKSYSSSVLYEKKL